MAEAYGALRMVPRNRYTIFRIVALLFGGSLALLTSVGEIEWEQAHGQRPQLVYPRSLPQKTKEIRNIEKPLPNDIHDGIIVEDDHQKRSVPKTPPKPFVVNTTALGPVVNPHPYAYIIDPQHICAHKDLFLLIYIHTAPENYQRRSLVRATWGNTKQYQDKVAMFFMMGRSLNASIQNAVEQESTKYKDIVQEDLVDAYHNLSHKAVGALRWVTQNCNHTKFILKSDDDVFVNTFALIKHMHDLDRAQLNTTRLLLCLTWYKMHVLRDGKWNISEDVIPDVYYPAYCSGMGYIMTPDVAKAIYLTSFYVKFFWVDDVYVTGMLPRAIGLTHVNFVKVFMGRREIDWLMSGPDWYKYVFCHLHDRKLFENSWAKLAKRAKTDAIPDVANVVVGKLADTYGPKKPPELRKELQRQQQKNNAENVKKLQQKKPKEEEQLL